MAEYRLQALKLRGSKLVPTAQYLSLDWDGLLAKLLPDREPKGRDLAGKLLIRTRTGDVIGSRLVKSEKEGAHRRAFVIGAAGLPELVLRGNHPLIGSVDLEIFRLEKVVHDRTLTELPSALKPGYTPFTDDVVDAPGQRPAPPLVPPATSG